MYMYMYVAVAIYIYTPVKRMIPERFSKNIRGCLKFNYCKYRRISCEWQVGLSPLRAIAITIPVVIVASIRAAISMYGLGHSYGEP